MKRGVQPPPRRRAFNTNKHYEDLLTMDKAKRRSAFTIATAAAGLFAAATPGISTAEEANVQCYGVNACKGKSSCKTPGSACKGQNACKGQGFVSVSRGVCEQLGGEIKG